MDIRGVRIEKKRVGGGRGWERKGKGGGERGGKGNWYEAGLRGFVAIL